MAAFLVQRVLQKKGMLQTTILAMELFLLSTGFFSAIFKLKQAIDLCCLLEFALSVLRQLGMSYRVVFSSPLHIFVINSVIVVLILVLSRFHFPKLEFEYDVFVGNLMDSLNVSTERWEGKIVADEVIDEAVESSTFLGNLGFDQESFESSDVEDDGEVSLKDVHVDCFRTLSGTWRVASSVDETPHSQKINLKDLKFSGDHENQRPEDDLKFSDENERAEEELKFSGEENERPEGEEEEEEDTMEATWIAIRQGRDREKNRKLKKSETWLGVVRRPEPAGSPAMNSEESSSLEATWKELRKSVTFNDAVSASRRGGLARDLMSTSDEMKKRFDDFINNFNNDLRLQRQESEQRLLAAISRSGL